METVVHRYVSKPGENPKELPYKTPEKTGICQNDENRT